MSTSPNTASRISTLLLLVGYFASGKSAVAERLAHRTGCYVLEMGDLVRSSARTVGEPVLSHAAQVLRSRRSLTFAHTASDLIKSASGPVIIVGLRTPDELSLIRKIRPSIVVALDASEKVRRARWAARHRSGERIPEAAWEERDSVERSWGLDEVIESADVVVDASRPLELVVDDVQKAWESAKAN